MLAHTFLEQVALNATAPLVATVIAGAFAHLITRKAQERREEQRLREQLLADMTEAASSLHLEEHRYARASRLRGLTGEALKPYRAALDLQYGRSRTRGSREPAPSVL